jgi:formiminoglutamase
VQWWADEQCLAAGAEGITRFVEEFTAQLDVLYLTIDLDVLPAAVAPGVSAPAAHGVPLPLIAAAVRAAAATGKLALLDVVELNPSLDVDSRTARAAARLIDDAVRTVTASGA